jgi:hypothetical protein
VPYRNDDNCLCSACKLAKAYVRIGELEGKLDTAVRLLKAADELDTRTPSLALALDIQAFLRHVGAK